MINHRNRNLTNFNLVVCVRVSTDWNSKHIYTISGIYTMLLSMAALSFPFVLVEYKYLYVCIVLSLLLLLLYEKNGMITALSLTVVVIGLIHVSRHSHENLYWIYVSFLNLFLFFFISESKQHIQFFSSSSSINILELTPLTGGNPRWPSFVVRWLFIFIFQTSLAFFPLKFVYAHLFWLHVQ